MRPSKPWLRSASAAFAPARPAPTITWVWVSGTGGDPSCEGEELLPGARVVADRAVKRGGHGDRTLLLDSSQGHAHVLGLEHDADAFRLQLALEPAGHLRRQPLLDLKRAREVLHDPCQLREPDDAPAREIPDV